MRFQKLIFSLSIVILSISTALAQPKSKPDQKLPSKKAPIAESDLKRWSHLDLQKDTIPGMSVDKAYRELLKDKKATPIIVGVIDSGFDIDHPDLKPVIYTNQKEIAGNGIDDDNNGYVDDVHGWNFLGDVVYETLELTRIVKKGDDGSQAYKEAKADYDKKYAEAVQEAEGVAPVMKAHDAISAHLKKKNYTLEEVRDIMPNQVATTQSIRTMISIIKRAGPNFYSDLEELREQNDVSLKYNLNLEFDGRKVLGDNPDDFSTKNYGNNNVAGTDKNLAVHGTHVAGTIAQVRNNNLGGDGVADYVTILPIRAVPKGDEYDKDIALAIRYAVDNGAKIINASFGKSYSPHKEWVYDAIKYAASKDVLIVHAAGNDGLDIDLPVNKNYPTDSDDLKTEIADNVLTIGALSPRNDFTLVAGFSNYGTLNVDIFAPGMEIYATIPDNEYKLLQGTSMASPNAAGVAALIRTRYPNLTAKQVKKIIMDSGTPMPQEVILGEKQEKRPFAKASKSGKIVNAYNALVMAQKMSK